MSGCLRVGTVFQRAVHGGLSLAALLLVHLSLALLTRWSWWQADPYPQQDQLTKNIYKDMMLDSFRGVDRLSKFAA